MPTGIQCRDTGLILANQSGAESWPMTAATFILIPKQPKDPVAATEALKFFAWAYDKGDKMAEALDYVPCVDGSELARAFFTLQGWSVQPCVRPLGAVHMTAGQNALRGSGPGQNRAFKNAVAHVGCPDRRIDWLCITCCSPSQPSHHAGYPARSRYAASATGFLYRSPLAIIAQAMRASLLASAMAATLVGRRASSAVSQGRCLVPWVLALRI